MKIHEQINLAPYTTFKIGGPARYFCEVKDQFDALTAFEFANEKSVPVFLLGGGSNILISDDGFNGLVVKIVNRGIEVVEQTHDHAFLKVASGEVWDKVVEFAVKNNWWGMENLSHIPGSTGAIAVQNVGAYGQEAKNIIESVTVFDKTTHQILNLPNSECGFAYRSSIFNSSEKGRYIIFYIIFKLLKIPKPILGYRDLSARFKTGQADIKDIRQAVVEIRDKKFPFPDEAKKGNAGSFFKNLIVDKAAYEGLKERIGEKWGRVKAEELEKKKFMDSGAIKIPTAFLLDICGLKDLEYGGAAINKNQPLVIINKTGTATASDVLSLALQVSQVVYEKCGVKLSIEPELIGFAKNVI